MNFNKNNKTNRNNILRRLFKKTKSQQKVKPVIKFTIDDPVNDIFDDEIYDDESILPKPKIEEKEKFEQPW